MESVLYKNKTTLKISNLNYFTAKSNSMSLGKRFSRNPISNSIRTNVKVLTNDHIDTLKKSFDSLIDTKVCVDSGESSKRSEKRLFRKREESKINKRYIKQIDELQNTLKAVSTENLKLRQLHVEIIKEQQNKLETPSTIHSFYQNIVLADNEQNANRLKEEIEKLKISLVTAAAENEKLVKENERLKRAIERYKELIYSKEKEKNYGKAKNKLYNTFIKPNTMRKSIDQIVSNRGTIVSKEITFKFSKENLRLDMILCSFKKLSRTHSIKELIKQLYNEMGILLKSCRMGIFLINKDMQELYYKEHGLVKSTTMDKCVVDFVVNGNNNYSMQPLFNSIHNFKDVIRTTDSIAIPIIYAKHEKKPELHMAIQLEYKSADPKKIRTKELLVFLYNY